MRELAHASSSRGRVNRRDDKNRRCARMYRTADAGGSVGLVSVAMLIAASVCRTEVPFEPSRPLRRAKRSAGDRRVVPRTAALPSARLTKQVEVREVQAVKQVCGKVIELVAVEVEGFEPCHIVEDSHGQYVDVINVHH